MNKQENMAQSQAEAHRDSLTELWQAIDHYDEHGDDWAGHVEECETCADFVEEYGDDDPRDILSERPLEIVWEKGEPFAVVLGIGGPHTEITGGGRASGSGYVLECYWGGDRGYVRGESITRTGDYFRDMVEEMDQ